MFAMPKSMRQGAILGSSVLTLALVGGAVWFFLFLLLFLIRRLTNGKVGVSRPVDVALVNAQRRVILSGEVAVANDRQSGLKDAAFIPAELPPLLSQVSITST